MKSMLKQRVTTLVVVVLLTVVALNGFAGTAAADPSDAYLTDEGTDATAGGDAAEFVNSMTKGSPFNSGGGRGSSSGGGGGGCEVAARNSNGNTC